MICLILVSIITQCQTEMLPLIFEHLEEFLVKLKSEEMNNRYLVTWIIYLIRSNSLESKLKDSSYQFTDPIVCATYNDKFTAFSEHKDFEIFSSVKTMAKKITMLEHLDVFKPQ